MMCWGKTPQYLFLTINDLMLVFHWIPGIHVPSSDQIRQSLIIACNYGVLTDIVLACGNMARSYHETGVLAIVHCSTLRSR